MRSRLVVPALALLLIVSASAQAAGGSDSGSFQFNLGWFFPSGNSDFCDANEAAFTLDHSDFNDITLGAGYVASINNYLEFGVGLDLYDHTQISADRAFTDQNGFPIFHDTRLSLVPMTVDLRWLPGGRYKQAGRDPRYRTRRPVPYIGAGVGIEYWEYEEVGDFVATDQSIVYDRFKESGVELETHVMAGLELPVAPAWSLYFEARQSWAEATPGGVFTTINPGQLDLGGLTLKFGGSFRF